MRFLYLSFLGFFGVNLLIETSATKDDLCRHVNCPTIRKCVRGHCDCINGAKDIDCKFPPKTTPLVPRLFSLAPSQISRLDGACLHHKCQQDCKCVPSCQHEDGYYCQSPSGYIGKRCDIAVPLLRCNENSITISIQHAFLQNVYSRDDMKDGSACFYMASSADSGKSENCRVCTMLDGASYRLTLGLPFDQCGTSFQRYTKNVLTVSNMIWANMNSPEKLYDAPVPVMRFICNYTNDYVVLASLQPAIARTPVSIERLVHPEADIELCKIGNACPGTCPPLYSVNAGAAYTVSETIHVTMSMNRSYVESAASTFSGRQVVILETMSLSCVSNKNSRISLVSLGCPTSELAARINQAGVSHVVCASFKVPRFRSCEQDRFQIEATLRIVDQQHVPICDGRSMFGREKRSLDDEHVDKLTSYVTFGPIYGLRSSVGRSNSTLFPMKNDLEFLPSIKQRPEPATDIVSPLLIVMLVCGTVLVGLFVLCAIFALCNCLKY